MQIRMQPRLLRSECAMSWELEFRVLIGRFLFPRIRAQLLSSAGADYAGSELVDRSRRLS